MCYSGNCPDEGMNGECRAKGVRYCETHTLFSCPKCGYEEMITNDKNPKQEIHCPECGYEGKWEDFADL